MINVFIDEYDRKTYCEIIEIMLFILDIERIENKRWYYLLEKKYGTQYDDDKIL